MNDCRKRNVNVDYIKGIAILLVVLGHTMTTSTVNSENSILFNFLWSLQMPLFFLVSGYLTKYSKPIAGIGEFEKFSKKRTVGYLIPFAVWTFAVRGLIFGQYSFFNIKNLAFNMDNGYWFLFSLWTICIVYGFSCFISEKASSEMVKSIVRISVFLLEIYMLHYLLISVFRLNPLPDFMSVKGFVICISNYIITLTLTLIITLLLNSNSVLRFLLFGKTSEVFKA